MRSVCIVPLSAYRVPANLHVEEGAETLHLLRRDSVLGLVVSRVSGKGASLIVESSTKSSSGSTVGLFPRAISSRRREGSPLSSLFLKGTENISS
ncbi:unnamed protein product [Microthlaspi erraticum]|uniref:Uncharacterized protein n=1 Tax=Microthlaspi erraticum TaxID=1685480 RepID=A0A6D2I3J3_9BRAS|nr:unnamed protein product [Microthlaspi erraticum]